LLLGNTGVAGIMIGAGDFGTARAVESGDTLIVTGDLHPDELIKGEQYGNFQ
jgi:hypothetical protein